MRKKSREMIYHGVRFGIVPDFTLPSIESTDPDQSEGCITSIFGPSRKVAASQEFVPETMMHTKTKFNHIRLIQETEKFLA